MFEKNTLNCSAINDLSKQTASFIFSPIMLDLVTHLEEVPRPLSAYHNLFGWFLLSLTTFTK